MRGDRALEALDREGVDFAAGDLVLARQILRGVAHGHVGGGVAQRFQEEVLEVDAAHAEAAAQGVGDHWIAAHRLGADAERQVDIPVGDVVGGLHQHLEAGAADPLHHVCGHLDRHVGIEPDVAWQAVGVEARLRHRPGDDGAHVLGRGAGPREHLARHLDAEVGGRYLRQRAVVVGEWRTHPVEQPDVAPACGEPGLFLRHGHLLPWFMVAPQSPARAAMSRMRKAPPPVRRGD